MYKEKIRNIIIVIAIVSLLLFFICYAYYDTPIEKEMECIRFKLNETKYENIIVKIDGVIKKSFLRRDIMEVNLKIGDKDFPNVKKHPNIFPIDQHKIAIDKRMVFTPTTKLEKYIYISDFLNKQYPYVFLEYGYWDEEDMSAERENYGILIFDKDMEKIVIEVFDTYGWNNSSGEVIVSTTNLSDAIDIINEITGWEIKNFEEDK